MTKSSQPTPNPESPDPASRILATVPNELADYYKKRAPEYESVYFRPDESRLLQLEVLGRALRDWIRGRDVLEIAAGTGWWTVHAAAVARSVTATDINEETLAIARTKPLEDVRFAVADAFKLEELDGTFNACLSCFWLSHVSRTRLKEFLDGVHRRLEPGSKVFMADNLYDPDVGGRLVEDHGNPDTYKIRTWSDGSEHRVIKNYYPEAELKGLLEGVDNLQIHMGPYYWWIMYETP
jgi:ubiquinone/menaquinone biosynthesis C-methylase UbiE